MNKQKVNTTCDLEITVRTLSHEMFMSRQEFEAYT